MEKVDQTEPKLRQESIMNKLISMIYSGPTIGDVESALSKSFQCNEMADGRSSYKPVLSFPEKGIGKIDNKYTVKIKNLGNGLADDGYKWRKYGQKSIKNSPNPRSYYRCTNPRCSAKKQVERSLEDPETLIVSYEGLHLHYAYTHFVFPRPTPPDNYSTNIFEANKKQKLHTDPEDDSQNLETVPENNAEPNIDFLEELYAEESSHGLLEDIVPPLVRNPCRSSSSGNSCSNSSSAAENTMVTGVSSPNSSLSSAICWSPMMSPLMDTGLLSSII